MSRFVVLLVTLLSLAACSAPGPTPEYLAEIEDFRAKREAGLQRDYGWLSVVGLHWLNEGEQRIGSEPGAEIQIPAGYGPPVAATVTLEGGVLTLTPAEGASFTIDDEVIGERVLVTDAEGEPDRLFLGKLRIVPLSRGDRFALRVRDPASEKRTHFDGLDFFEIDPAWRIEAQWEPYDEPREVQVPNVLGTTFDAIAPGRAVFEFAGKQYALVPTVNDGMNNDEPLFFVFGDETNGELSYGAGRFLVADPPQDGRVILDFNFAYSPPCSFTEFATCPLPMPENRLDVAIAAGEKKPPAAIGH